MGNLFGTAGAFLFILSYFLLQRDKDFAKSPYYSAMNLLAAALMLGSVCYDWNIGAVINNVFWVILSLYGLYTTYRQIILERVKTRIETEPL